MKTTTDTDRIARCERLLAFTVGEQLGVTPATVLGPMDPSWRLARQQARADVMEILKELAEPALETRGAA